MTVRLKIVCMFSVMGLILGGVTGCSTLTNRKATTTPMQINRNRTPERPIFSVQKPAEGSLWSDSGAALLYEDLRARRVGDSVTVDIVENTSSSMDANTKASRTSSIDAGISQMAGYMRALEEANKRLNKDKDGELNNILFKASMENKFDGKGTSDRKGQVTASIGAVVTEVLPNGNLLLEGNRQVAVNDDVQTITVSGIVRPQAISSDNTVHSTYLANAEIKYVGDGPTAQRPGIVTRILQTPFHWIASIFRRIF